MMRALIQSAPLETQVILDVMRTDHLDIGAVASFTGYVRADNGLMEMSLEHYPGATEVALERIIAEAMNRFELIEARIVHRVGPMRPGEAIVFVAAASKHRQAAFDASNFMMDYLKTEAPFWKKETRASGSSWVCARESDVDAKQRW